MTSLPFPRGITWLCGRRQVSWLPACLSPRLPEGSQWPAAAGLSGHSGGSAPDLHRLPLRHRPFNAEEHIPAQGRPASEPFPRLTRTSGYEPKRIGSTQERLVEFDLDRYLRASKRLDLSELDWHDIPNHPLS